MAKIDFESVLPEGTMFSPRDMEYYYKAFCCDQHFLMSNPRFDWRLHIEQTIHDCLRGTINRFMKVV